MTLRTADRLHLWPEKSMGNAGVDMGAEVFIFQPLQQSKNRTALGPRLFRPLATVLYHQYGIARRRTKIIASIPSTLASSVPCQAIRFAAAGRGKSGGRPAAIRRSYR